VPSTQESQTTSKAELLSQIEHAHATWDELAEAALRSDVHRPGAIGNGDFADAVAHLNGWRTRSVDRLEAAANGTEPPPPPWPASVKVENEATGDVDAVNDWFFEQGRERPVAETLAEATDQYRRMRAAVESISEPDLLTPGRYPWLDGRPLSDVVIGSVEHLHDEHEADIRNWLTSVKDVGGKTGRQEGTTG